MAGMIGDTKPLLDQRRDALQSPQLGLVAPVGRSPQQRLRQLLELGGRQARLGPEGSLGTGGFATALLPFPAPDPDRLVTDMQGGRDVSDALALGEADAGLFFESTPLLMSTLRILGCLLYTSPSPRD